jgi:hypothetical protein
MTTTNSNPLIVITGSRDYSARAQILNAMSLVAKQAPEATFMHGGAGGIDSEAGDIAVALGFNVVVIKAAWDVYGRSAGHRRNREMLDHNPTAVWAFWDGSSPGTYGCIREARIRKIPTAVWKQDRYAVYNFDKPRNVAQHHRTAKPAK